MQAKRGFTLVEILIVVVILGILAAIVIPQFTQASTEAKQNSLASDLQSLRSQIQLYKVQHNDVPPGNLVAGGVISENLAEFPNQMLFVTDVDGNTEGTPTKVRKDVYLYGPYLERVPDNPFNTHNAVGDMASDLADPNFGWVYDPNTGEICAGRDSTPQADAHQDM
jgi:general secretion pathway protein G